MTTEHMYKYKSCCPGASDVRYSVLCRHNIIRIDFLPDTLLINIKTDFESKIIIVYNCWVTMVISMSAGYKNADGVWHYLGLVATVMIISLLELILDNSCHTINESIHDKNKWK